MYLERLNWSEAEKVLKNENLVVVVPVGSTEQHGCVGPLGTDFLIPQELASRLEKRTEILVTPTIPFGVATHHTSFPGTIDIGLETMYQVMRSVFESLKKHGAKRFVVLNGHGGNDPAIEKAALEINRSGGLVALLNWWSIAPALNPAWPTGHGDAQEVSAMLAINPDIVKMDQVFETKVNNLRPSLETIHLGTVKFDGATVKIIREIRDTINSGGFGGLDASKASKEWGVQMLDGVTDYFEKFINEFRQITLK